MKSLPFVVKMKGEQKKFTRFKQLSVFSQYYSLVFLKAPRTQNSYVTSAKQSLTAIFIQSAQLKLELHIPWEEKEQVSRHTETKA